MPRKKKHNTILKR